MPKKINYQLSKSEQTALERIEKTSTNPRMRQRAMGLRLLHSGKSPQEVAELLNVSVATVYNWHQKWRTGGVAGLADEQRSGRPALATAEYCAKLEALIETAPSELGYGFTLWTAKRLLAHLAQETGILLSEDGLRNLLQKHQFVYRRPKHDLKHLQDSAVRAAAAEALDTLKKSQSRRDPIILCGRNDCNAASCLAQMLDETGQTATHPCGWATTTSSCLCGLPVWD